jgi:glycosyltransferase involved in cell wall biosynthesis
MSLKRYGIYLDWGPMRDLRAEGLGRQLAAFLKGAAERPDVRFVIACPSWGRAQLRVLCDAEHVPQHHFDLLSPELPLALRIYEAARTWRESRRRPPRGWPRLRALGAGLARVRAWLERSLVSTRSPLVMAGLLIASVPVVIAFFVWQALSALFMRALRAAQAGAQRVGIVGPRRFAERFKQFPARPLFRRFYRHLEQSESDFLIAMINRRSDIAAWYCPTAFWPQFNGIKAPRLMCVPDSVLSGFPVGFERLAGLPLFEGFRKLQSAVGGAGHWVTYSEHVRREVVLRDFNADPASAHVVPHAAQQLTDLIAVSGTANDTVATDAFSRQLFNNAMRLARNPWYTADFRNENMEYIFYASQFRPNKNVPTLLRAFEHLLRVRYLGVKLILTGSWEYRDISSVVEANRLSHDVLFLHNLPLQQLAALYRRARLAVNPSLSEGGFPFTFTEALSVGTPVVMARIAVTEEIVTDPDLQAAMLFDPYDWRSMAERIEWGLQNRAALLAQQKPLYERLARRTWRHVVDDHIDILDGIAAERGVARKATTPLAVEL